MSGHSDMTTSTGRSTDEPDPGPAPGARWLEPGSRLFRQLRFTGKNVLLVSLVVAPLLFLIVDKQFELNGQASADRRAATRQHVEIVHGVLEMAHAGQLAGRLSLEQAQEEAKRIIGALRYADDNYFWISDMHPRIVLQPANPALEGKDVGDVEDTNGFALFHGFIDQVRDDGAGFVEYTWPRPGSEEAVDKVSYVIGFEPWGWILGTGIYVDDLRTTAIAQFRHLALVMMLTALLAGYAYLSFVAAMRGGFAELGHHLRQIAGGNLATDPRPRGRDEAADLLAELGSMARSLARMVDEVRGNSEQVAQVSRGLSGGAEELAARTERAASSIEASAAAMEEITTTTRQTAERTVEAARTAREGAATAAAGGQTMEEVMQTMQGIQGASARIGEITGTIDTIAFQTNLLALNAAVEAARAGESGRGFAVVASEVRSLAQNSAEAAGEIKRLVSESVREVDSGVEVVQRACRTIEDTVGSSRDVDRLLEEISVASREQSAGIERIGESVLELDRMTEQNASAVKESTANAALMQERAEALSVEVSRFRLPEIAR